MTLDTCYYLFEQDSDNLLSLTAFNDLIDWRTENIGQVSENAEHSKTGDDPSEKVDSRHQKRLPESETNNKKVILSFYRIVFFYFVSLFNMHFRPMFIVLDFAGV